MISLFRKSIKAIAAAPQAVSEECFASYAQWQSVRQRDDTRFKAQWYLRSNLACAMAGEPLHGLCSYCGQATTFVLPANQPCETVDLRESLRCSVCGFSERIRAALPPLIAGKDVQQFRLYLTEQASPTYAFLKKQFALLQGSEYGLDAARRRRLTAYLQQLGVSEPINERDITALDFADASLDAIGCFDVLEHVPDYQRALREFAGCLRPGGELALSAPFAEKSLETLVRARVRGDGSIEHLLPAEMHGDPVAGDLLCFYHFGWDLLDSARSAGFSSAQWCRGWSPQHGIFGLWTLRAVR